MTEELVVRMYNVRFGDAILVTVPDRNPSTGRTITRRILIDVGNAPKVAGSGEGGSDEVFEAVVGDILDQLDGKPLDLYVMTHEHLDHAQGLFYAAKKLPQLDLANRLQVRHAWLTASAAPDYYDEHPEARKQKLAFEAVYTHVRQAAMRMTARPTDATRRLLEVLANNDPTKTRQCVDFLRTLSPRTHYVHRESKLGRTHPFREAKLSVWAPEEDTSDYYGRFVPMDSAAARPLTAAEMPTTGRTRRPAPDPSPPPGVDVGAFLRLVEARRAGIVDNLFEIDKASNNTSLVFALEWRGWRLLFSGDAEIRSWKTMQKAGVLQPVHFLKVSHHGSHNGTPSDTIFDAILPSTSPDGRPRQVAISTWEDTYQGIPHPPTNARLAERATVTSTLDHRDDLFYEVTFPDS
jgi:beta-lactamase superfamily II metal-dependent hydrolase